ncbi:MAG: hypothetical protein AB7V13_01685 [Pseudorhodoplanes sp.]|uniref:hypothetical protein n=1 Tax=Pseudorhodoplanes sp. TaxID=1934341 RepID=UPI003D110B8E
MKLVIGMVAYLAAVAAVAAAVFAGVLSVVSNGTQESPVLASTDGRAGAWERERDEETAADPNRVPVWIVPTAKYDYTPSPIEPPKRRTIIGEDAQREQAKAPPRTGPERREAAEVAPRRIESRRDNDPFFRD